MKKSLSPGVIALIVVVVVIVIGIIFFKGAGPANRSSKYPQGDPSQMPKMTMPNQK
ncbi:MAG: hypothetical protein ACYC27_05070 [Armatimonadota bacterium]